MVKNNLTLDVIKSDIINHIVNKIKQTYYCFNFDVFIYQDTFEVFNPNSKLGLYYEFKYLNLSDPDLVKKIIEEISRIL